MTLISIKSLIFALSFFNVAATSQIFSNLSTIYSLIALRVISKIVFPSNPYFAALLKIFERWTLDPAVEKITIFLAALKFALLVGSLTNNKVSTVTYKAFA